MWEVCRRRLGGAGTRRATRRHNTRDFDEEKEDRRVEKYTVGKNRAGILRDEETKTNTKGKESRISHP